MGWNNILISEGAKLSCCHNTFQIENAKGKFTFLFSDINTVMLESESVLLTKPLLRKFCEENILVFICDKKHLPCGVITPFNQNSNSSGIIRKQLNMKEPLKKRIWKLIIEGKLLNQQKCLNFMNINEKRLTILRSKIKSGDKENLESRAAKIFFDRLYGKGFCRSTDNSINIRLNYGYAIIRSAIARSLVVHGFYPPYGIHHHSHLNQFNFADDCIEPFRPLVDLVVSKKLEIFNEFDRKDKIELYKLLSYEIEIAQKKYSISKAIDIMIASLVKVLEYNDETLLELPKLIELKLHNFERGV